MAEQLGRSTCKLEAQSLSPALTASWSNVLSHPKFKSLTMVINSQLAGFLTPLLFVSGICSAPLALLLQILQKVKNRNLFYIKVPKILVKLW